MKPEKNNTYCAYPFRSIMYLNWNDNKPLTAWPCCFIGGWSQQYDFSKKDDILKNLHEKTPQEVFNSKTYKKLRYDALNNIKNPLCNVCWDLEEQGVTSSRFYSQDDFFKEDGTLSNIQIKLDNNCNLGCRFCKPSNSSYLKKDLKYFIENNIKIENFTDGETDVIDSKAYEWLLNNTHQIKILSITGGEPFFSKKFYEIVDRYIETGNAKNTKIVIHTNGTLFNKSIIEKLNKFKKLQTSISIDSVDENYEYIRYPINFSRLEKSIEILLSTSTNLDFVVICLVLSSLNLNYLKRHEEWCRIIFRENFKIFYERMWDKSQGISINNLNEQLLKDGIKDAQNLDEDFADKNRAIEYYESALKNNFSDKQKMLKELLAFDGSRKQNFKDYLDPMLVDWLT